ncbi:hypothetical protein KIPB_003299 [Kipferlia bialata]|uniref:Microbial-type PARG catalytic domain-containing protein n=1 Tax=Kipferlia bialata TaxID=797122 RepID=A0A9K3CTN8_9EUKA|nr:hypothetical protein KIPB_003299 [Kipferlia bialata]|eukprot:g3299.t1
MPEDTAVEGERETTVEEAKHRFTVSSTLRLLVAPKTKRVGVRGIVEDNAWIMSQGGFTPPDGEREEMAHLQTEVIVCPPAPPVSTGTHPYRYQTTEICVANTGGRYVSGGRAQEEDLCRLLPQLYPSLKASGAYPIPPGTALLTRGCKAVRVPGTYTPCQSLGTCTIITAAMPCGIADRRPKGGWLGSEWADIVALRIRSVLNAARESGHPNIVLGAFGCGAFGNPAGPVAALFKQQLTSPEFR